MRRHRVVQAHNRLPHLPFGLLERPVGPLNLTFNRGHDTDHEGHGSGEHALDRFGPRFAKDAWMDSRVIPLVSCLLATACAPTIQGAARQASRAAVDESVEQLTSEGAKSELN